MMSRNKEYAETYAQLAMEQMRKYGIPASVTLAQGMLESSNGQSELARKGNAHFGIKCQANWNGSYLVYTDDRPDEKFCTYSSVQESYEHHSAFLKENDRYADCFALPNNDYRGWCRELQRAGYASNTNYAKQLCKLIESNGLDKYDRMVLEEMRTKGVEYNASVSCHSDKDFSMPLNRNTFMLVISAFGVQSGCKGMAVKTCHEAVLATESDGKVISVGEPVKEGEGKTVCIAYSRDDGSCYQVTYRNLDSVHVKAGENLRAGQQVGISGESLQMEVKRMSAEGLSRSIDPAAYLADISRQGNLQTALLYNGKDLLAKYLPKGEGQCSAAVGQGDRQLSPEEWMKKLLSSEDSKLGLGNDPIVEIIMALYTGLMALARQVDGHQEEHSKEKQMANATEALLSRKVDLTPLAEIVGKCRLGVSANGTPLLETEQNGQQKAYELSRAEVNSLVKVLHNANLSEEEKRMQVSSLVHQALAVRQASLNYEQAVEENRQQGLGQQR